MYKELQSISPLAHSFHWYQSQVQVDEGAWRFVPTLEFAQLKISRQATWEKCYCSGDFQIKAIGVQSGRPWTLHKGFLSKLQSLARA